VFYEICRQDVSAYRETKAQVVVVVVVVVIIIIINYYYYYVAAANYDKSTTSRTE
jgi:hypothetical protein